MKGVYDKDCVYEISNSYILDKPFVIISQLGGQYYDSILDNKQYFLDAIVTIIPIGFDVRNQQVVASTQNLSSQEEKNETYASYNEIRYRTIQQTEGLLPAIVRISKEDFIKHAELKKPLES